MSSRPTPGATLPGQLRAALRPLVDRPGHAAAVATTLAVVVAVSLPASLLVRVRGWSPFRLAPGLAARGPDPLDIGVPWEAGAPGPAGLRAEELEGFVVLLALLVAAVVIVCVLNLAVLLIRHLSSRRRELAIRRALGGTRSRLRRDLLLQGAVLAAVGVVLVTPEARALGGLVPGLGGGAPGLYYAAAVAAVGLTVAGTTWIPVGGANRLAPRQMMARE